MRGVFQESLRWLPMLLWANGISAQTCMVLSRPTIGTNGTATFDLSLRSSPGDKPAALQWTFQYSRSDITALAVDDGPALVAAGKSTFCAGNSDAFNCLAVGLNSRVIGDGIIGKVTATLASGADSTSLLVKSSLAGSPEGYFISVIAKYGAAPYCQPPPHRGGAVGK
jgi:hypothetical protein